MIEINILEFIPQELRQQAQDTLVDFVSEQAKKFVGDGVADKLKQLRTDGAFRKQFDKGLDKALKRFTEEYYEKDEDLVEEIALEKDLFKSPDVKQALMTMLKSPGSYLADEGDLVAQTFDSVLTGRKNRERVNTAMMYLLRCLVEELWHLPELQPVYSLQFQKITAEAMKQQVELQKVQLQALVGVNEGVRQALLQLTEAISEKRLLSSGSLLQAQTKKQILHNLPNTDYGQFVGREKEISKIHEILRPYPYSQHSLVTIDGIGGIGKSTLALEVAHYYLRNVDQLPDEEHFDAIVWASAKITILTADGIKTRHRSFRTLKDIYSAIAITLQREDIIRSSPDEQAEIVRNALTKQRTLVIIDNFETIDDESIVSFLQDLPAPTKAVVTTRHRIDVAFPVRLTGMLWEESKVLIQQICQNKNILLRDDEAYKLFNRTGGVPLALVWSIAKISIGYSVESVLSGLGSPKNDVAYFCFDEIFRAIENTTTFKILLALSLFAKDADRQSIKESTKFPELDLDDGITTLEKLSLINKLRDGDQENNLRFSLLPLTRTYVANKFQAFPELYKEYWRNLAAFYVQWSKEKDRLVQPQSVGDN